MTCINTGQGRFLVFGLGVSGRKQAATASNSCHRIGAHFPESQKVTHTAVAIPEPWQSAAMAPSDNYFTWMDEQLKGECRAFGGEPCKVCGDEIPGKAYWKHRDRHVCSPECNSKLIRRFKAKVKRGEARLQATYRRRHTPTGTLPNSRASLERLRQTPLPNFHSNTGGSQ